MTPTLHPRRTGGQSGRAPKRFGASSGKPPVKNTGKFIPRPRPTDSKQPSKFGPTTTGARPIRKYASPTAGASSGYDSSRPSYGSARPARKFGTGGYDKKPSSYGSKPSYRKSSSSSSYEGGKPAFGATRTPFRKATSSYEGVKPPSPRKYDDTPRATYGKSARTSNGNGRAPGRSRSTYAKMTGSYGDKPSYATARPVPIKIDRFSNTDKPVAHNTTAEDTTPTDTSWGKEAEWYNDLLSSDDNYQTKVILPHLKRLMAIKAGEKIADVACGQGFFSFAFADAGASVHGADISPELVAIAEKRRTEVEKDNSTMTRFTASPSNALADFEDTTYSQATVILALQNIEDVPATLAECARILTAGGRLHMVINHPAYRIPKASSWGWDNATGSQYRRVDRYLTETKSKISMHPGSDPTAMTLSFHRPFQYFVKALARKGFALTNLEEWTSHKTSDSGPRADAENKARAEFPMFLYMEAKKVA